ncbi:MAG TPA: LapA family protein [Variovorax sp.]
MGIRTGILFFVVLVIAALAALNWGTLATPTLMSLGFMQVTAPLGMIMLGLTVLLGILFVAYVVYLQGSVLLETRRHTKEMQVQRDLADKAEASRFTELRNFLEAQENTHMSRNAERHAALLARVEQLENTLAAHVGQLEDRLERRGPLAAAPAVEPPPRF